MPNVILPFPELGETDEESIQNLYDTVIRLRKELEYLLSHIDDQNIINVSAVKITSGTLDASKVEIINFDGGGTAYEPAITGDSGVYSYFYIDFLSDIALTSDGMWLESLKVVDIKTDSFLTITRVERVNTSTFKVYCNLSASNQGVIVNIEHNWVITKTDGTLIEDFSVYYEPTGMTISRPRAYLYEIANFYYTLQSIDHVDEVVTSDLMEPVGDSTSESFTFDWTLQPITASESFAHSLFIPI